MNEQIDLIKENKELKSRLTEAEDILRAIKSGEVDAFITDDQQVFSLKSADHAYRILVETINEGAATLMLDGTVMYCNNHLSKMLGIPIEKIIGISIINLVCSNEHEKLISLLNQCENSTARDEFYLKKSNKTLVPVLISCNSLKLNNISLCIVITDLSKQKRTELELEKHRKHLKELIRGKTKALHDSEKRLQLALQVSNSFAFEWYPINDKIIRSDSCGDILGLTGKEVQSDKINHYFQYIHSDDREKYKNILKMLNPEKSNYRTEYRFVCSDGKIVVLEEMGQASFDTNGNFFHLIGTATNITERKIAENILKRDKATLYELINEQANELIAAHEDLEHAKRLSDIGTLAATVAHELRNPLAAMRLAVHNIKKRDNNPDVEKILKVIDRKIAESDQIINNLLFYSRLKIPIFNSINIFDIIIECLEIAVHSSKKKIKIIQDLDPIKNINIKADSLQLKEVFNNILNNAIDIVLNEIGQIKILALNEENFIKIVIEDNGAGINKDILDKIFDPFFTTKAKGTGLGLTVCKQIINMHDGEILVNSISGQGTSFIVRLPI